LKWAVDAASEYVMLRRDATYISVLLLNEDCGVVVGFTPAVNDGILSLKKDRIEEEAHGCSRGRNQLGSRLDTRPWF
jgi:hypothetical protein